MTEEWVNKCQFSKVTCEMKHVNKKVRSEYEE